MRRRLDALFGRSAAGPGRPAPGARRPSARREGAPRGGRGRPFPAEPRFGYVEAPPPVGPALVDSLRARAAPPREAVIVAAVMNHPDLLAHHAEELAQLDFSGRDTARLLRALLALAEEARGPAELRSALDAAGLGEERTRLEAQAARSPLWSIRPDAAPSDAWHVLRQALGLHHKAVSLHRELRSAERALAEDASEPNFARLRDIQGRLANLDGVEAAIEGFGVASGRSDETI
ncbi:MAG: hypothetical protein JNK46_07180 [Methylobacteriaceae bacterium]|nr:hypothetical protein [Methylobacteriaceae bacterium]